MVISLMSPDYVLVVVDVTAFQGQRADIALFRRNPAAYDLEPKWSSIL